MQIDKEEIIALLRERGDDAKADQAQQELPGQVDTERDAACCPSSVSTPQICWADLAAWVANSAFDTPTRASTPESFPPAADGHT